MISLAVYENFEEASVEVLDYLHSKLGFGLWMVTRVESDNWIVLKANDHGYNVKDGDVFRWTDSFCSQMVQGNGPCIAPKSEAIAAYSAAPIGQQVEIGAYIGVPLNRASGDLFGTLCAIDPQVMPEEITKELPLVELLARLLMTILENELTAQSEYRRAERASKEALTDSLTGLYNRRGWDKLIDAENIRCQRYGQPASVLSIDVDNLKTVNDEQGHAEGDALLRKTTAAIKSVFRGSDVVARIGGDEFAVLVVDCESENAEKLVERLKRAFGEFGVSASVGMSMWQPSFELTDAFDQADQNMFKAKSKRRRSR